jgi:hypothetical protein
MSREYNKDAGMFSLTSHAMFTGLRLEFSNKVTPADMKN